MATDDEGQSVTVGPDEVLAPGEAPEGAPAEEGADFVSQPAKLMRIGTMVKTLLDEARSAPLDEAGRVRLREIYETSIAELSEALSPDLREELEPHGAALRPRCAHARASCASPRPRSWAGSRGSSTASRRRSSPSRRRRPSSSREMRDRSLNPGSAEPRSGTYL